MVQQVTLKKAEFCSVFSVALALFCRHNQTEDGTGQDQLSYAHAATAEDFKEYILLQVGYTHPGLSSAFSNRVKQRSIACHFLSVSV